MGYIPRGFCGATGRAHDVALVLVIAEPGNHREPAPYEKAQPPEKWIADSADGVAGVLRSIDDGQEQVSRFHRNLRYILNECWPQYRDDLGAQLKRTWLTNAVLCSADSACGAIPKEQELHCARTFLKGQLEAFPRAFVVALGRKAVRRLAQAKLAHDDEAPHPSTRAAEKDSRREWSNLGKRFQKSLLARKPDSVKK